jgi:hypothetical protein
LVGAKDGRDDAVKIYQDVDLYAAQLESEDTIYHQIPAGRYAWLQVARGLIQLNGTELREGDGIQLGGEKALEIGTAVGAEILLFDLA